MTNLIVVDAVNSIYSIGEDMQGEFASRVTNYKNASFRVVSLIAFLVAQLSDKKAISSLKATTLEQLKDEGIAENTAKAFLVDASTISINAIGCLDLESFEAKLNQLGINNTSQAVRLTNANKVVADTINGLHKSLKEKAMDDFKALSVNLTLPLLDNWIKEYKERNVGILAIAAAADAAAADKAAADKAAKDATAAADKAAKDAAAAADKAAADKAAADKAAADAAAAADKAAAAAAAADKAAADAADKAAADKAAADKAAADAAAAMLDKIMTCNSLEDLQAWQAAIDTRIAVLKAQTKKSA